MQLKNLIITISLLLAAPIIHGMNATQNDDTVKSASKEKQKAKAKQRADARFYKQQQQADYDGPFGEFERTADMAIARRLAKKKNDAELAKQQAAKLP